MDSRELVVRQQRLLLRSAQLRLTLADQVQIFKRPLALADRARNGWLWLSRNPLWPLGALLVLTVLKPRRVVSLGGRVWWAWTTFKRLRNWLSNAPLPRRQTQAARRRANLARQAPKI